MLVVVLHFVVVSSFSFLIFILLFSHCFSTSSFTLHQGHQCKTPFYTFSPGHRRLICDTLICSTILFLPRVLRPWVGIFYPQAFFTLHSFTNILTYVYQRFPGSQQFFLEVCRASYWSSKHRPSPSVCLIYSNPQTSYSEQFSFKFYHTLASIACGESLIYLLLICFKLFLLVQSHM